MGDGACLVQEHHVEGKRGVAHPHLNRPNPAEIEQHAVLCRHGFAEHQSLRAFIWIIGNFGGEKKPALRGNDPDFLRIAAFDLQRRLRRGSRLLGAGLHQRGEWRVLFDCGPLGYNRIGGHAHADALAVLLGEFRRLGNNRPTGQSTSKRQYSGCGSNKHRRTGFIYGWSN